MSNIIVTRSPEFNHVLLFNFFVNDVDVYHNNGKQPEGERNEKISPVNLPAVCQVDKITADDKKQGTEN